MKDEEYVLFSENRQKSIVARSARSKRTHCGRGGRVKLPSDYMTKRELNAMNGKCEIYRLNDPMNWSEWLQLPDDLKVAYIKSIREKYGVSNKTICLAMGVPQYTFSMYAKDLGFAVGRGGCHADRDKEGFLAWWHGVRVKPEEPVEEVPVEVVFDIEPMKWDAFKVMTDEEKVSYINQIRKKFNASDSQIAFMLEKNRRDFATEIKRLGIGLGRDRIGGKSKWDKEGFYKWIGKEPVDEPVNAVEELVDCEDAKTIHIPVRHYASCLPRNGSMNFEGNVDEICNTIRTLLCGSHVKMSVAWNVVEVEHG